MRIIKAAYRGLRNIKAAYRGMRNIKDPMCNFRRYDLDKGGENVFT